MRNRDNETLKMQITRLQAHFPESLGQAFIVNYPWIVYPIWKVAQLWMDAKTVAKGRFGV